MEIENGKGSKVNLMTQYTYQSLLQEVEVAKGNSRQSLLDIGEAAGSESDWHDNAAFDHANIRHDVDSSHLRSIETKLKDIEIIKPSKKKDKVSIGNSVVVKFDGEDNEEMYTILGHADSGRQAGWISFESPLGSNLMSKRKGETINFIVDGREQKAKIVDILQGNF